MEFVTAKETLPPFTFMRLRTFKMGELAVLGPIVQKMLMHLKTHGARVIAVIKDNAANMGAALRRTERTPDEVESDPEADSEKFDGEESNEEDEMVNGS